MGRPKANLEWHGSTLLHRVTGIVSRAVDGPVVVVRAPDQELPLQVSMLQELPFHERPLQAFPLQELPFHHPPLHELPAEAADDMESALK